jgi:hypothetical protein
LSYQKIKAVNPGLTVIGYEGARTWGTDMSDTTWMLNQHPPIDGYVDHPYLGDPIEVGLWTRIAALLSFGDLNMAVVAYWEGVNPSSPVGYAATVHLYHPGATQERLLDLVSGQYSIPKWSMESQNLVVPVNISERPKLIIVQ